MDYEHLLKPRSQEVRQNASFLRRLGAFIVDILVIDLVMTAPFTSLLAGLVARAQASGFSSVAYTQRELAIIVVMFLMAYLYFVLFEYVLGQTIGMMVANTRISDGQLWQILVRNSFVIPLFPFIIFWVVEPLAVLFGRRGVLERLSGTRTLYTKEVLF